MDGMVQASQTPENAQQLDQSPTGEPPKKPASPIKKIFNASSWFVFFALLPVTVLILLSQNTIPGDLFYPIKRGMENVVLAAATVSPATRVAFRTDLTERRFDEAEKLLLSRADTTGLSDFVEELETAQQEVSTLSSPESKKVLTEKLIKKIDEYQNKLVQVQAKTTSEVAKAGTAAIVTLLPTNTPAPTLAQSEPTPTLATNQQVTPYSQQSPTTTLLTKPSPAQGSIEVYPQTSTPTSEQTPSPSAEPSPTQFQIEPTETSSPNLLSSNIEAAIDDTQKRLDEIKDKLKEKREEKGKKEKKIKEEDKSTKGNIKDEEEKRERNKEKK